MIVDGAIGVGCMLLQLLVDRSLGSFDDCASDDDIDLIDDVAVGQIDDASEEYRILHHQKMACEMSAI